MIIEGKISPQNTNRNKNLENIVEHGPVTSIPLFDLEMVVSKTPQMQLL